MPVLRRFRHARRENMFLLVSSTRTQFLTLHFKWIVSLIQSEDYLLLHIYIYPLQSTLCPQQSKSKDGQSNSESEILNKSRGGSYIVGVVCTLAHHFYFHSLFWCLLGCQVETKHLIGQFADHGRAEGERVAGQIMSLFTLKPLFWKQSHNKMPDDKRISLFSCSHEKRYASALWALMLHILSKHSFWRHFGISPHSCEWNSTYSFCRLCARAASTSMLWFCKWIKMKPGGCTHPLIDERKVNFALVSQSGNKYLQHISLWKSFQPFWTLK